MMQSKVWEDDEDFPQINLNLTLTELLKQNK